MDSLIKAGAFDRFGDRVVLLHNLDLLLAFSARLQRQQNSGQTDIFGDSADLEADHPRLELQLPNQTPDSREQLLWERELLGIYLSQHPLELFEKFLSEQTVPINSLTIEHDGKAVNIGGSISDVREISTKNGQKMAFVKIEDLFGEVEVILFPNSYQQTVGLWERDKVVLVRGKVNARDKNGNESGEVKVMVDDAREITSQQAIAYQETGKKAKVPKPRISKIPKAQSKAKADQTLPPHERVYIRLASTSDQEVLLSLKQTIDSNKGDTEVVLVLGEAADKQAIKLPGGIDRASDGLLQLRELVGQDNLVIK